MRKCAVNKKWLVPAVGAGVSDRSVPAIQRLTVQNYDKKKTPAIECRSLKTERDKTLHKWKQNATKRYNWTGRCRSHAVRKPFFVI